MSRQQAAGILALAMAATAALAAGASAADVERRSGTVVAVEAATRTFVLEEVGQGRRDKGGNEIERLRIGLGPTTPVIEVVRSAGVAPDGWPGGFAERTAGPDVLREGAFVTVMLRREGRELTADQVTVVAPSQ